MDARAKSVSFLSHRASCPDDFWLLQIAIFNAALFICAILAFVGILTDLAIGRQKAITSAIRLTLIGCPVVNTPIEWSEWIPGMSL